MVVCEGWRDSAFARGFLKQANVEPRSIDVKQNPRGSGHDWVMTTFVQEVANLNRFSEGRGVLGLVDEDGAGTASLRGALPAHAGLGCHRTAWREGTGAAMVAESLGAVVARGIHPGAARRMRPAGRALSEEGLTELQS